MPKGGHSNLLLQWMEYMACLFLFQEISTHRTETIYQHTGSRHTQPCTASGSLYRQSPADTIFFTPLMINSIFHFPHKSLVNGYDGGQLLQLPFQILL